MLVVLRRNGESIVIGEGKDQVTVRFLDPAEKDLGYQVRMSVTAPASTWVACAESWGRGVPSLGYEPRPAEGSEQRTLVFRRRCGEGIQIGEPPDVVLVSITEIHRGDQGYRTRVGVDAPRHITVDRGEVRRRRQRGAVAGAAGRGDQDIEAALVEAGIGEPARGQLAHLRSLDTDTVRRVTAETRRRGGGPGVIVEHLRAEAQAKVEADVRRKAKTPLHRHVEGEQAKNVVDSEQHSARPARR